MVRFTGEQTSTMRRAAFQSLRPGEDMNGSFTPAVGLDFCTAASIAIGAECQLMNAEDAVTRPIEWHKYAIECGANQNAEEFRKMQFASFSVGRELARLGLITDGRRYLK